MAGYLGFDIGGTAIKWATFSESLSIVEHGSVPTDFSSSAEVLDALSQIALPHLGAIDAVGVSVPGSVYDDDEDGTVHRGGALPYMNDVPLARELRERLGLPVAVYNDGKCCALGEYAAGALKGARVGVAVALGTGIGGGIVINGRVLNGPHAFAGELSFLSNDITRPVTADNMFAGTCGWYGLRNLVFKEKGIAADDPAYQDVDGRTIFEWINDGDEAAQRGLDAYALLIDRQLLNLQAVLDPDVFAIAGGISSQQALIDALNNQMQQLAETELTGALELVPVPHIVQAQLGNDANLYGAVYHAKALVS